LYYSNISFNGEKGGTKFKSPLHLAFDMEIWFIWFLFWRRDKEGKEKEKDAKIEVYSSYSHILLPTAIHNALIWRVLTVLLAIGALPASRSVELVPRGGFEMSRKNPGTVIEIFRDNLGIEKILSPTQNDSSFD
jgi:hypothetical protein